MIFLKFLSQIYFLGENLIENKFLFIIICVYAIFVVPLHAFLREYACARKKHN